MLSKKNYTKILKRFDEELIARKEKRSLILCGGSVLIVMDIVDRQTRDVDVVEPELDSTLKEVAKKLATEFGLSENWLNNGPESLRRDLLKNWKKRIVTIFKGKALVLQALGREDLLATKLFAFCDREDDWQDVLKLKPTKDELERLFPWVLERDGSPYWPKRVEDCFKRIKKEMKYE
jgi:hypothetical protein